MSHTQVAYADAFCAPLACMVEQPCWQVASLHLEGRGITDTSAGTIDTSLGPVDVVLGYRNPRKIKRLAERSEGRLRVVDAASAYFRLAPAETEPEGLYAALKHLLRLPERKL